MRERNGKQVHSDFFNMLVQRHPQYGFENLAIKFSVIKVKLFCVRNIAINLVCLSVHVLVIRRRTYLELMRKLSLTKKM